LQQTNSAESPVTIRSMVRVPDAPQLVFATHRPPWPLDNGARIRTARLAQGLSKAFELTLVTFADGPTFDDTRASRAHLASLLPQARLELVAFDGGGVRAGGEIGQLASHTWGTYATPGFRAALSRLVRERPDAVLHLDSPGAGLAGLGLAPGRTVYGAHNIEHHIWRDVAWRRPVGERQYVEIEWRKIQMEELRCWREADLCTAVSEVDAGTMRAAGARRVEVCPNGADAHEPLALAPPPVGRPLRLLFVGWAAHWPYAHGLAWLTQDVVGERPAQLGAGPGVTYHGRVDELEPFYAAAHAVVVPMFEGSGTRLKVIEASFLGRPVISTTVGVQGLPLTAEEHYLHAETVSEWVAAIERVRAGGGTDLPAHARGALRDFTWPRIAAELADLYRELPRRRYSGRS
jgi:glycosyltransferase involved in cell wall biosynthesis